MNDDEDTRFRPGDRVRISTKFTWAKGVTATVSICRYAFAPVEFKRGYFRDVPGVRGPVRYYWLELDEPQMDADGDGPCFAAEIGEEYLEAVRDVIS